MKLPRARRAAATMMAMVGLLAGCGAPATVSLAAARGAGSSRSVQLTKAIRRVMREASIPGAIVGVWQGGKAPYVQTFGVRNRATGRPLLTSLYMRVGSETKTFTVTALLQLVDRKKIGLDDPIARYVQGVPDGTAITLRELADMRSGLYNYTNDPAWQEAFGRNPYRQWLPRQLLAYSFSHPLMFKPGTKFFYSNTNTILLGLVVEKVARLPLATFIKRYVLRPEHLAHTVFPPGAQFPAPHAQGYAGPSPKGPLVNVTNWNPSWGWAAGAMISTLGDLRNWARIVATGELLTPATQKQRERFLPTGIRGVRAGYGLGLFKDNGWIGHNGSLPGYQSLTIYLPSKRATVVVLVNSDINYQGSELTTLLGEAITKIITPHHVYYLPPSPQG